MKRFTFVSIFILLFVSSGVKAINVQGDITTRTLWKLSDSPIEFSGNVHLFKNAELLIEPGVEVNFNGFALNIGYSSSTGKLKAEGVQFNNSGNENQLRIRYNSLVELQFCSFSNVAITVENSTLDLQHNRVENVTYPLAATPSSHLTINSLHLINVKEEYIRLGGNTKGATTLKKMEIPYYLSSSIYVRNADSLYIEEGVEINLANRDIVLGQAGSPGYLFADKVRFFSTADSDAEIMFDDQSGGYITHSDLNHVYLHIPNGTPALVGNTISKVRVPLKYDLSSQFYLADLRLQEIEHPVFEIGGKTKGNVFLKQDSIPYVLFKNISVCNGDTFRFEKLLAVDLNGHDIKVGADDASNSCLLADGVHFYSSYYTHDKSIEFGPASYGSITNCTLENVNLKINEGKPFVKNVSIADVDLPCILDIANDIQPEMLTFSNVAYPGIAYHGNLRGSRTLRKANYPYYIDGSVNIYNNDTLLIESGTEVIFATNEPIRVGYNYTGGHLIAKKVKFSWDIRKPDARIEFNNGSTGSLDKATLDNVFVKVSDGSPHLTNMTISNVYYPVRMELIGKPDFKHLTFNNVKYSVIGLEGYSSGNCTVETNHIPIRFSNDVIISKHDTLMFAEGAHIDMGKHNLIAGNITPGYLILNGVTFTSDAETENQLVFKDGSTGRVSNNRFDGIAWLTEDISAPVFTQNVIANTQKAFLISISSHPVLEHTILKNVTDTSVFLHGFLQKSAILPTYPYPTKLASEICVNDNAVLTIPKGKVIDFNGNSISLGYSENSKGGIKADSVFFVNSGKYSAYLYFRNGNDSSIVTHTLFDNVLTMFRFGNPTINYCDFLNADEAFYHYEYDRSTNVKYNYWGSKYGPKHRSNPVGKGEELSDSVLFKPFRKTPNLITYAKPYPEIHGSKDNKLSVPKDSLLTLQYHLINEGAEAGRGVYCFSLAQNLRIKKITSLADKVEYFEPGDTIRCLDNNEVIVAENAMYRLIYTSFNRQEEMVEIELTKTNNERAWMKQYFQLAPKKVANKMLFGYNPFAVYPSTGAVNQEGRISEELLIEGVEKNYKADL